MDEIYARYQQDIYLIIPGGNGNPGYKADQKTLVGKRLKKASGNDVVFV